MKGLIFDIKRFAIHDGPGIRTTVFFKGCPLKCWWCHNPEGISEEIISYSQKRKIEKMTFKTIKTIGYEVSVDELKNEINKDNIFMEEASGGVTFSGGEPLSQPEFLKQILMSCKKDGLHTAVDTSGFASKKNIDKILPYTDLFLFDIKSIDSELHKKSTGVRNEIIIDNFNRIIQSGVKVIARIPIIPSVNNKLAQVELIIEKLLTFKAANFEEIHLLSYHKIGNSKFKRFNLINHSSEVKEPDKTSMEVIADKFIQNGFKTKIH